ncbi:unnamed protein product [Closterium sp. Yama58-4]|nr:unnamed protein product [Closterium sp. Yama58-4]
MEWVEGERTSDLLAQAQGVLGAAGGEEARQRAKQKLLRMVGIGVESSLEQLLVTGVLHADPHPGNLLLTPQGQVAFLVFDLLCRMERQHQEAMLAQVFAWGHVLHLPLLLLASSLSSTLQLSGLWPAVSCGAAALVLQILFHVLLPALASSLTSTLSSYLDFGLLCRMERQHQQAMLAAVAHLVNGEWSMLAADLAAMDVLKPTTDRRALTMVSIAGMCTCPHGEWTMLAPWTPSLTPTTDRRALTMVGSHTHPPSRSSLGAALGAALSLPMPWIRLPFSPLACSLSHALSHMPESGSPLCHSIPFHPPCNTTLWHPPLVCPLARHWRRRLVAAGREEPPQAPPPCSSDRCAMLSEPAVLLPPAVLSDPAMSSPHPSPSFSLLSALPLCVLPSCAVQGALKPCTLLSSLAPMPRPPTIPLSPCPAVPLPLSYSPRMGK